MEGTDTESGNQLTRHTTEARSEAQREKLPASRHSLFQANHRLFKTRKFKTTKKETREGLPKLGIRGFSLKMHVINEIEMFCCVKIQDRSSSKGSTEKAETDRGSWRFKYLRKDQCAAGTRRF